MLKREIQLHRFTAALNFDRDGVTSMLMSGEQIRKFNLTVEWIDIVAVLIDFVVADGSDNIAHLQSSFRRRCVWINARNIAAARFARFTGKTSQLRIARGKE